MNIKKLKDLILNRITYGCDVEDFSYLKNGLIKHSDNQDIRVNLIIGTIDKRRMYGGLTTAFNFFNSLKADTVFDTRIIVSEIPVIEEVIQEYSGYVIACNDNDDAKHQIVDYTLRNGNRPPIFVRDNDVFICTYWTTMYLADGMRRTQSVDNIAQLPIIYLIQDYEPGFYKWSSEYVLAESTYRMDKIIAVINSQYLQDYMHVLGYNFYKTFCFDPKLNTGLKDVLNSLGNNNSRKKRIIIYGRPFNARNCFSLIISSLKAAIEKEPSLSEWEYFSLGAKHKNIALGSNAKLICKGKMSIKEYGEMLSESKLGISLMCSPHPSYPPLEMATFGVVTITNNFISKDLSSFSNNIRTVDPLNVESLSLAIIDGCKCSDGIIEYDDRYLDDSDQFASAVCDIKEILMGI
jgi:hypothetical protein